MSFAPPSLLGLHGIWARHRAGFALGLAALGVLSVFLRTWIATALGTLQGLDFVSFYAAARLVISGAGTHLYQLAWQEGSQSRITAEWVPPQPFLPYIHPPFFTLAIAPLGLLSFKTAYLVWGAVNLLLAAAAVLLLLRATGIRGQAAVLGGLAAAAFLPLDIGLLQGQSAALQLLCLSAAFHAWVRKREGWAGVLVGLSWIKPQLVLLVPLLFLVRRGWRALLGFLAAVSLLVAASLAGVGVSGWLDYFRLVLPWAGGGSQSAITGQTASSLRVLLERLPGGRPIGLLLLGAALLLALLALSWRPHRLRLDLALAIALSVVLSPYQNFHDLTLLAVPGFALAGLLRTPALRWPRLGLSTLILSYAAIEATLLAGTIPAAVGAFALTLYLAMERLAVPVEPLPLGQIVLSGPRPRRVVVLPAYRAERTLRDVVARIPRTEVDRILLVDDASSDRTAELALELALDVIKHPRNLGYGGNQKTCYANALLMGAEVVVMLHPDGQYDPSLVPALCRAVEERRGDVVLGSRWLGLDPAKAGMPWWKRVANRFLTWTENRVLGLGLSEYHTGYRAYSRRFLETVPFAENANDFVFDTQILVQAASFGFHVAEIPAVGRYFRDASSVGFRTSVVYGVKTLLALAAYTGHRAGLPCQWLAPRRPAPEQQASLAA